MMSIYLDCGCYDGASIVEFINWHPAFPPRRQWQIYAFDPNPDMAEHWQVLSRTYPEIKFVQEAVWTEDSEQQFAVDKSDLPHGSTLFPQKEIWHGQSEIITVKTFDFSAWLRQFTTERIILKMDIEGAEFPVLNKMIEDKTIGIPDHFLIEWHDGKLGEEFVTQRQELEAYFAAHHISWSRWR